MATKKERHAKILEIIRQQEIETQEELADELNKSGINITQASVSRDINTLGLVKVPGITKKYRYSPRLVGEDSSRNKVINLFRECVVSVNAVNNLVVVKTLSGCGAQAGSAVDKLGLTSVMGSVAGDDTLLVVVRSNEEVGEVLKAFTEVLNG